MNVKINKILSACFMICLLASSPSYSESEYKKGDVLVVLKPGISQVTVSSLTGMGGVDSLRLASIASSSGAYVVNSYKNLSEKSNTVFALVHSDIKSSEKLAKELLNNPEVLAASPNYIARISATPNDPRYSEQWGLKYINAPEAWDVTTGSNNIYAAIVDTGVDWNNPDLRDNVDISLAKTFVSGTSSAMDDNGHGTHVAGILGARGNNSIGITGTAWNIKIIPVKVMNSSGAGYLADIMSGLEYVVSLVNQGYNIVTANLSIEFYASEAPTYENLTATPLWRACKQLDELNSTVIVVAAGNYGAEVGKPTTKSRYSAGTLIYSPNQYVYPASFRGLNNFISVSALNSDGSNADFTNTNATIAAPGSDILSTYLQTSTNHIGSDGVSLHTMAGTSMAAPYVSGGIALLAAIQPDRTAYQYKCAILGVTSTASSAGVISGDVRTSAITKLDLAQSIEYQENHLNSIAEKGTEWDDEFSDYNTDSNSDNTNNNGNSIGENNSNNNSGGGGGGCNGFAVNLAGLLMLFGPLLIIKKN